jgi:hypothetical protein
MTPYRSYLLIAATIAAGLGLITPARSAVAQGALLARRTPVTAPAPAPAPARAPAAAPAPAAEPALQPARSVLHQLVGRWRFAIWFAGNFDGPPDASGTRVVQTLYDDLRLQWTEQHDSSTSRSQGVLGFDPKTGQFYSSAVYSDGSGVEILTGTLNPAEPLVTLTPVVAPQPGRRLMAAFTLTLIDPDHFTWVPLDRGWRAVFTRER